MTMHDRSTHAAAARARAAVRSCRSSTHRCSRSASWFEPRARHAVLPLAAWPSRWLRYDVMLEHRRLRAVRLLCRAAAAPRVAAAAHVARRAGRLRACRSRWRRCRCYLPPRNASTIDLLSNTAGALLGGLLGAALARAERVKRVIAQVARAALPAAERSATSGLALLVLWLVAQINPGDSAVSPSRSIRSRRIADRLLRPCRPKAPRSLIEAAESAFQLIGVGLFLALLLRERRYVGGACCC